MALPRLRFFGPKSVDYIVRSFERIRAELSDAEARNHERAAELEDQINELVDRQEAAFREAERAATIQGRLTALLQG